MRGIEKAIMQSELSHRGEIRFAVESCLHPLEIMAGKTAKKRALEVFSSLHVWDTENNSGVLIYLLLADRDFEIVADRGIHTYVGNNGWEKICDEMEMLFRRGEFENGVLVGIRQVGALLQKHFPANGKNENELPDKPMVL